MNKQVKKESSWSFDCSDELRNQIDKYKQKHNLRGNKEVIIYLLNNDLDLDLSTLKSINKICNDFNITKKDLLKPLIEKHINKTLKKDGVIKEKNKHTSKAENELINALKNMIDDFKNKPVEERKFISPTFVYKFFMLNTDKYKQKNYTVIKRVLSGLSDNDISFIEDYHKDNNLTVRSNLKH